MILYCNITPPNMILVFPCQKDDVYEINDSAAGRF
jgi:hypothetical protein